MREIFVGNTTALNLTLQLKRQQMSKEVSNHTELIFTSTHIAYKKYLLTSFSNCISLVPNVPWLAYQFIHLSTVTKIPVQHLKFFYLYNEDIILIEVCES